MEEIAEKLNLKLNSIAGQGPHFKELLDALESKIIEASTDSCISVSLADLNDILEFAKTYTEALILSLEYSTKQNKLINKLIRRNESDSEENLRFISENKENFKKLFSILREGK